MLEDLDRQVAVQMQAALFARASGADVEVPDPFECRRRFHDLLFAVPAGEGSAPASRVDVLREAFGLRAG